MPKLKQDTILPTSEEDLILTKAAGEDQNNPELADEFIRKMKPVKEVLPNIPPRVRGRQKKPVKQQITIRLDADIIDYFKLPEKRQNI